jgi:hypothetical protein
MNEVKSFSPIDLALLRRIAARGISLEVAATVVDSNPLETAIYSVVGLKGLGSPTYILRTEQAAYAAQMRLELPHARLTLLAPAPTPTVDSQPWISLVEAMVQQAGRRGAHLITAEAPLDSEALYLLRQAGFMVYSRERLYHLPAEQVTAYAFAAHRHCYVRPMEEGDMARLHALYASTVPQMVQQVAPPPIYEGLSVVYQGRVMGCWVVYSGRESLLLQPFLHPELYDLVPQILAQALALLPHRQLYVRLRAYQEWMHTPLEEDFGFTEAGRYALVARHTVAKRETHVFSPLVALEQAFAPNPEVALELSSAQTTKGIPKP